MSNTKRRTKKFERLGAATSDVVMQAASVLEEELAAGIEAAKKAEERFRREGQFNPQDVAGLIERLRLDGHDVVDMVRDRLDVLKSEDADELAKRLANDAHQLVDLAAQMAVQVPDLLNRLMTLVPNRQRENAKVPQQE
jgi:predicted transcriptional regulator